PPGLSDPSNPAQMPNLNSKGSNAGQTLDHITITDGPKIGSQDTNATIAWTTNKNASTYVRYGTDPNNLDRQYWRAGGETTHTATLSNLQPGTHYYFAIIKYGNTVGTKGEFQTTGGTEAARAATPESSAAQTAEPPAAASTPSNTTEAAAQQPATTPATPERSAPAQQTVRTITDLKEEGNALPETASPLPLLGLLALGSLAIGVITMKK
ncbi:MAG TPA: fibronectin type III domain-containing protein, partial [Candidatus Angelobacter sp.]|nr:fibronectin type III domain-containing protein [Candidatus Angelobacter sp.]